MSKLPKQNNENVIVGYENSDDAGVFRLDRKTALVQTLDFFTPIADEPKLYGRIAAINSLNDVYAMGGKPITALSIVCYPQIGDWDVLGEILLGGQKAMNEENVAIIGGHSVDDSEIKIGYSVSGLIDSKQVVTNSEAKAGDLLVLTKPIGTGIISTGIKLEKADEEAKNAALKTMSTSARVASKAMLEAGANACTDVTGFGLLGHAFEMAKSSKVTFKIDSERVPLLPDVIALVEQKMLTRGDKNNRLYVGKAVSFDGAVSAQMQSVLFDPQTAGGLLISMSEESARRLISEIESAKIIGEVVERNDFLIEVE